MRIRGVTAPLPIAENLRKVEFEGLPYDGLELDFKVLWDFKQVRSTLVLSTKKQYIETNSSHSRQSERGPTQMFTGRETVCFESVAFPV